MMGPCPGGVEAWRVGVGVCPSICVCLGAAAPGGLMFGGLVCWWFGVWWFGDWCVGVMLLFPAGGLPRWVGALVLWWCASMYVCCAWGRCPRRFGVVVVWCVGGLVVDVLGVDVVFLMGPRPWRVGVLAVRRCVPM